MLANEVSAHASTVEREGAVGLLTRGFGQLGSVLVVQSKTYPLRCDVMAKARRVAEILQPSHPQCGVLPENLIAVAASVLPEHLCQRP